MLCLIDGDGYLFDDNLISQGTSGGGEAATRLLSNIKSHIQKYEGAMNWKIIVRVYANLEGLLKKYAYIDFDEEKKALRQFVAGFTQSQPLFDFVDAGEGKERADHKIKGLCNHGRILLIRMSPANGSPVEQINLFINNTQCEHIMLGVAHDNGYLPTLDPYKNDPATTSRISLLKPVQQGRGYHGLPFEVIEATWVFRTQALPNGRPLYKNHFSTPPVFKKPSQPFVPHSQKPAVAYSLTTRRPVYPGPVLLNKNEERVDEYLGTQSETAEANLDARIYSGNKLCNVYHLRGECEAPKCPYSHEPALQGEELIALALRARHTACQAASRCRSTRCVFGHLCPQGYNCTRGKTCYFKKVHYVDPQVDHEAMDTE
ncbi:MAG: hypothetical protein Q9171_006960 [Xanthocarpia ochracea]